MPAILPLIGYGATALGIGAGGLAAADAISGLPKALRNRVYDSYNPATGEFETDTIGKLLTPESKDDPGYDKFMEGFGKRTAQDPALRETRRLLGDKFIVDPNLDVQGNLDKYSFQTQLAKADEQSLLYDRSILGKKEAAKELKAEQRYRDERKDAAQARLDLLNSQRIQIEREDRRYNERLDREERNRRQEAVMAMMGGLTSLGAAFAM